MKKYLSLLLISLILFSCRASEADSSRIWDLEAILVEKAIRNSDYSIFDSIDFNKMERKGRLGEISRLREGGAFYFSFVMAHRREFDWQLLFLEDELIRGSYKEQAAGELYRLLSHAGDWERLARILRKAREADCLEGSAEDYLVEALYESGLYKEALQIAGDDLLTLPAAKAYIGGNGDLSSEVFLNYLYSRAELSEATVLYGLIVDENRVEDLSGQVRLYLEICLASTKGDRFTLDQKLPYLVVDEGLAFQYPSLIYRLRRPILQSGLERFWAERLGSVETFHALFTAARLFRSERQFSEADRLFRKAYALAGSDFERDRSKWYLMDLYSANTDYLTGLIEEAAPLWSDPYYFSDILEEHLANIAARGRWDLLERVYPLIVLHGDGETAAAYSWVLLNSPVIEKASSVEKKEILSILMKAPHFSFYYVMGHVLAKEEILFREESPHEDQSKADLYLLGFFDFSFPEEALERSKGMEELLGDNTIRLLSKEELDRGNTLRSIQLSAYLTPPDNRPMALDDLKLRYPRMFDEEIEQYSEEYQFPPEILKGIIRTESAFTHDIVSHAGAVGLSQLMPATAADQARKLGIGNPDLTDPETNIRIGSSYVRWILDRPWSDNFSQVLIAYNGGGGNLRKWKRMFPSYSDELFIEALPYKETRNYVKKVLTSSVVYGAVYGDENPIDIVRKIYPDFDSLIEIAGQ